MLYQVSRGGQMFGPYSMDELRRYLASGNIMPSDLAKSEEMAEWVPVSTLLGSESPSAGDAGPGAGYGVPYAAQPSGYTPRPYEAVPNLHWALLLLLEALTLGVFAFIWDLVLASWTRKIGRRSDVPAWYYASAGIIFCQYAAAVVVGRHSTTYGWIALISFVIQVTTRFMMRTLLERHYTVVEPIGLRLSGIMTFFFGEIYFQYHLNRIYRYKQQMAFGV